MAQKFKKATALQRIKLFRNALISETEDHGSPCGCFLCEILIFDTRFKLGERDIKKYLQGPL